MIYFKIARILNFQHRWLSKEVEIIILTYLSHIVQIYWLSWLLQKNVQVKYLKKNKVILKIFAMVGPWLKEQHVYKWSYSNR